MPLSKESVKSGFVAGAFKTGLWPKARNWFSMINNMAERCCRVSKQPRIPALPGEYYKLIKIVVNVLVTMLAG
jgi:hypothetical protein